MKHTQIKSIAHLKRVLGKHGQSKDFIICLNGGLRSSKSIAYDGKLFYVINFIDDTEQELTESQLASGKHSNIAEAIEKGAFYQEV